MLNPNEKIKDEIPDKDVSMYIGGMIESLYQRIGSGGFVEFLINKCETKPMRDYYKCRTFNLLNTISDPDPRKCCYEVSLGLTFDITKVTK